METKKAIDVLNTVIEINNDRIEGYQTASKETEERELKNLFFQLIKTSEKFKTELANEVIQLGGTSTEETKTSGKFFRVWMDVKAALASNDRKVILESCEFGEDAALNVYRKVLKDNLDDITGKQQTMLREQYNVLKADHDKVKSLRDAEVEYK